MWIKADGNLINLSLAKVIGISSSGGVRIDDFYIGMNWEDVGYFLDGLAKIIKEEPSDSSVFDVGEVMVVGGKNVE